MSGELKNKFKNGMIPDEVAFGQLIDEATKETDLSGYATKEEIPVVPDVSEFITLEDIPETDLSEYAKVSDIPSLTGLLSESDADALYVRKDNLPNFEEYAKKTDIPVPQDISHLATKSEIPDVSSFITLEEIPPTDLSDYAKVADVPSLEGLLTSVDAEILYVNKKDIEDIARLSDIPDISDLINTEELEASKKVDFLKDSNSPPPQKTGAQSKRYKVVHKKDSNTLEVYQVSNQGNLKYTFIRNSGGSGYGVNYELMRLVKVEPFPVVMLYKDVATPKIGSVDSVWNFTGANVVERNATQVDTAVKNESNRHVGKANSALQAYSLAASTSATWEVKPSHNHKNNIAIFSRGGGWTSAEDFEILIGGHPIEKNIITAEPSSTVRVFEFSTPKINTPMEITVSNTSTKDIYIAGLNLTTLEQYDGQDVDNYIAYGSGEYVPFIDNQGASEYAFNDLLAGKQFGSFHGGEVSNSLKVVHKDTSLSQTVLSTKKDWEDIPEGEFYVTSDFSIFQETTLISRAIMYIQTNFDTDGTLFYDMSYNIIEGQEPIVLKDFYTSLTCTSPYFNKVKIPKLFTVSADPQEASKSLIYMDSSANKIIQTTNDERQELHIRHSRFNEGYIGHPSALFLSDYPQYRKIYYAPIVRNSDTSVAPTTIQFSKGLDFYVY